MTDQPDQRGKLHETLALYPTRIVACSGGIDSLVLATLAHRAAPEQTVVAHTVTPAVPGPGTARVVAFGEREAGILNSLGPTSSTMSGIWPTQLIAVITASRTSTPLLPCSKKRDLLGPTP